MVQIAGKYELVKNENLIPHLLALGVPEEQAKKGDSLKPKVEIKVDGKKITFDVDATVHKTSTTFVLDEEIDETMPLGHVVKSTATLSGDTLTVTSRAESEGKSGKRIYKFSDSEVVMTSVSDDSKVPSAKRFYKRV